MSGRLTGVGDVSRHPKALLQPLHLLQELQTSPEHVVHSTIPSREKNYYEFAVLITLPCDSIYMYIEPDDAVLITKRAKFGTCVY